MNAMKFCGADGFPISRDPPEGGTFHLLFLTLSVPYILQFPISRDPPEGGTSWICFPPHVVKHPVSNFSGSPRRRNLRYSSPGHLF